MNDTSFLCRCTSATAGLVTVAAPCDRCCSSIRPEHPEDKDAIYAVHEAAFPSTVEATIVDALRAGGRLTLSLVADVHNQLVGHIAFSPVHAEGVTDGLGLAPVSVLPAHQRSGIGGKLIEQGLAVCRRQGVGFVVVIGEPAYYRRFGFTAASEKGLVDEFGAGGAFQLIELRTGAIPTGRRVLRYAPEFYLSEP